MKKIEKIMKCVMMIILAVMVLGGVCSSRAQAASKKKTIYVIDKVQRNSNEYGKHITKYHYNSKGLIIKEKEDEFDFCYKYNKKNQIESLECVSDTVAYWYLLKCKYNKKGKLKNVVSVNPGHTSSAADIKFTYNRKGKVKIIKNIDVNNKCKYKNTYKKNKLVKVLYYVNDEKQPRVFKYAYDKKGNLNKGTNWDGDAETIKNTYKKKRLIKSEYSNDTIKYTYKKIKVNKKYASKIKKQQRAFKNRNLNFVFPALSY